jgi:hypothetical protein
MFDQLSAEILASLIKGFPTTTRTTTRTTTTKQNVDPAVHFVYSRVKIQKVEKLKLKCCSLVTLVLSAVAELLTLHLSRNLSAIW